MKEILGSNLDKAFQELNILATKTFENKEGYDNIYKFQVWEMADEKFKKICDIPDEDWKDNWGWWRESSCIYEGRELYEYTVNGKKMLGYIPEIDEEEAKYEDNEEDKEFVLNFYKYIESKNFTAWLSEVFNLSTERNITSFAISLAKENGITLAEFMDRYQS